eukprot:XP_001690797.1 predicted protein [Chlamydomonas reinhardtii]
MACRCTMARSNGAHAPPGLGRCGGPLAASGASPVARAGWRFGALLPHMTARGHLAEAGVDLPEEVASSPGVFLYRTCPVCGGGEGGHDPNTFSMMVAEDYKFVWYRCFRANKCAASDKVWAEGVTRKLARADAEGGALPEVVPAPSRQELQPEANEWLDADALAYFAARGISPATLRAAGVYQARDVPHPTLPGVSLPRVVVYPYTLRGVVVNATFHDIHNYSASAPPLGAPAPYAYGTFAAAGAGDPRNFVMAAGAGAVPTGVAGVDAAAVAELHPRYRDLVLVEDELERLALMEVLSPEPGVVGGEVRVTLALKEDAASRMLAERDGPEALTWLVEQGARPYPVKGLMHVGGLWDEIIRHWYGKEATAAAVSTGWPGLDEVYRVTPGELTIVTGVPNSGKSHWLDALAVQLANVHEWRVGFASFEKSVVKHGQNLIELAARTSMFTPDGRQNMTPDQFHTALDWVNTHFFLIRHPDMADEGSAAPTPEQLRLAEGLRLGPGLGAPGGGAGAGAQPTLEELEAAERAAAWLEESRQPCTIDWVLGKATQAVYRHGIRGLVIDPYNELEQQRGSQSETEYISAMLSKVKRWAQRHMVHVWLVAHPKSFEEWDGSPPSMYDISGSAHWYNKADMGVVVHRYTRVAMDAALKKYQAAAASSAELQSKLERLKRKPVALTFSETETLIKVVKARNKTSGAQGDYVLNYSKEQCRFLDPNFPDA